MALEFDLAADILRTAVAPTWTKIGQRSRRTALNFFLGKEIEGAEARGQVRDAALPFPSRADPS